MNKIKNIISLSIIILTIAMSLSAGEDGVVICRPPQQSSPSLDTNSVCNSPEGKRLFQEAKEEFSIEQCVKDFCIDPLVDSTESALENMNRIMKEKITQIQNQSDDIPEDIMEELKLALAMKVEILLNALGFNFSELPTKE